MRVRHARFIRAVLIIFLFTVSTFAIIAPRAVKAVSSSGLDGVGVNTTCQAGDGHCRSQLLTTTHGRDMLILIVLSRSNSTPQIRTSSDTFNFWYRLSYSPSTDPLAKVWEFYAVPLSSLNSENITVIDQCCFIKGGMQVFAVSGVSTGSNNGFDPNPSIPAKVSCPGDGCGTCQADYNTNPGPCSATIQTSTMDFVFATVAINDAPYCGGYPGSPAGYNPPAGFTNIASQSSSFEVDYSITSTPQTSVVFDCNGTDAQAIVLDAVTISAQSPTFN